LQARGYKTTIQKLDPYINIDIQDFKSLNETWRMLCLLTMGAETILDLGHYERFLNVKTVTGLTM